MENTQQCSRGDWTLRWRVLGVKGELLSRAFYTLLLVLVQICLSSGMENTRQCSRGDSTRALQGLGLGIKKRILVSCVLYVADRY